MLCWLQLIFASYVLWGIYGKEKEPEEPAKERPDWSSL